MMPSQASRRRLKYAVALVILGLAFVYLVWTGFRASFQYTISPSEYVEKRVEYGGKTVRVVGMVEAGSIMSTGLDHRFYVTDGTQALSVHHRGVLPNSFREGVEVVVSGQDEGGVFKARKVITKCASKYEAR